MTIIYYNFLINSNIKYTAEDYSYFKDNNFKDKLYLKERSCVL